MLDFLLEPEGWTALLISSVAQIFLGALILKFAASLEDDDSSSVSIKQLLLCSLFLSIIPPVFVMITVMVLSNFLIIGLMAAVLVWFFSSRAIIMGFMEVLEGEATKIIVWYYLLYFLLNYMLMQTL